MFGREKKPPAPRCVECGNPYAPVFRRGLCSSCYDTWANHIVAKALAKGDSDLEEALLSVLGDIRYHYTGGGDL